MTFSIAADLQQREDLNLIAPNFDKAYYLAQNPDLTAAGGDPLVHFFFLGWREGLDPNPGFDTDFYLAKYPDVAASDTNPFVHYLRWGAWAGRLPHQPPVGPNVPGWTPLLPSAAQRGEARQLMANHFDPDFYRAQNPDLRPADGDPLLHYLVWGWRLGLKPCRPETFDEAFYRETYPDMEECDASPLLHYLRWGAWAGRLPRRRPPGEERIPFSTATPGWVAALPTAEQLDEARHQAGPWFDEAHYLSQGPDLAPAAGDPFLHFLVWGWRQGHDPSPDFDVSHYLNAYPEVAETEVNPLLHYLSQGIHRNMVPRRPSAFWKTQLDFAWPARDRASRVEPDGPEPLERAALLRALAGCAGAVGLAVVLSHDDITRSVGGVRNVACDDLDAFRKAGWRYLHLSPPRFILGLAASSPPEAARLDLSLDGVPLGTARISDLIEAVAVLRRGGLHQQVVVHHFAGHAPEHVQALVAAAGTAPPVVWVHDFFTLCPSYALMRNDIAFCGAPPVDSAACTICCYGEERRDHLRRLRTFFSDTLPTVLAPSESALALWRRNGLDHARAAVVPLVRLRLEDPTPRPVGRPIRVAHLGTPVYLKGWAVFDALVSRQAGTGRYAFYQLGLAEGLPIPPAIRRVPVQVDADNRDAMARAVADHAIDVVVLWSMCRETFSFTAHEALAGGAFVVTRQEAGNIWPAVQAAAPGQGCALEDEASLMALFEGDRLDEWIARPRASGIMMPGDGTCGWLLRAGMAA